MFFINRSSRNETLNMQTVVDGPYAGDYYAMDGTYGTQTTAVTGGCLYRYISLSTITAFTGTALLN